MLGFAFLGLLTPWILFHDHYIVFPRLMCVHCFLPGLQTIRYINMNEQTLKTASLSLFFALLVSLNRIPDTAPFFILPPFGLRSYTSLTAPTFKHLFSLTFSLWTVVNRVLIVKQQSYQRVICFMIVRTPPLLNGWGRARVKRNNGVRCISEKREPIVH